jgi:hypothetical protein
MKPLPRAKDEKHRGSGKLRCRLRVLRVSTFRLLPPKMRNQTRFTAGTKAQGGDLKYSNAVRPNLERETSERNPTTL